MSFTITGWPEGHPHLTKIDNYPFGYSRPMSPNPLEDQNRDGYASSFRQLYRRYKTRAADKDIEFKLTEQDFYLLTSQPCFYCAAPPSRKANNKARKPYIYNGLDRWNCTEGYTIRNTRPCCWCHNDLKGTLSYVDFYRHALSFVLAESSRTALDIGDLQCLELLIKLFPNVRFLKEHRLALLEGMRKFPNKPRFNWLLQPAQRCSR